MIYVFATLEGREDVDLRVLRFTELEEMFPDHKGGRYRPSHCNPSSRIAIVIPYRDREIHLKLLLLNLIPKLRRQLTDFTIYVIEQVRFFCVLRVLFIHEDRNNTNRVIGSVSKK